MFNVNTSFTFRREPIQKADRFATTHFSKIQICGKCIRTPWNRLARR